MEEKKEVKYNILITGKGTHFEIPVNQIEDLENLDEILKVLKKKLQNVK
jgi:dissimilatory sulfite reductase (desulfoviridin) alpha/beta subunit